MVLLGSELSSTPSSPSTQGEDIKCDAVCAISVAVPFSSLSGFPCIVDTSNEFIAERMRLPRMDVDIERVIMVWCLLPRGAVPLSAANSKVYLRACWFQFVQ